MFGATLCARLCHFTAFYAVGASGMGYKNLCGCKGTTFLRDMQIKVRNFIKKKEKRVCACIYAKKAVPLQPILNTYGLVN